MSTPSSQHPETRLSCPDACDEDLPVGTRFSSHPVPLFACARGTVHIPLSTFLVTSPHFPWHSHSLAPLSFQQTFISVSFPSDTVSSTFSTFFQVLVKNACDATAVGQLRWPRPVPFIHPARGDVQPCSVAKLAHAQNNPFNSWMLALSFQGLSV